MASRGYYKSYNSNGHYQSSSRYNHDETDEYRQGRGGVRQYGARDRGYRSNSATSSSSYGRDTDRNRNYSAHSSNYRDQNGTGGKHRSWQRQSNADEYEENDGYARDHQRGDRNVASNSSSISRSYFDDGTAKTTGSYQGRQQKRQNSWNTHKDYDEDSNGAARDNGKGSRSSASRRKEEGDEVDRGRFGEDGSSKGSRRVVACRDISAQTDPWDFCACCLAPKPPCLDDLGEASGSSTQGMMCVTLTCNGRTIRRWETANDTDTLSHATAHSLSERFAHLGDPSAMSSPLGYSNLGMASPIHVDLTISRTPNSVISPGSAFSPSSSTPLPNGLNCSPGSRPQTRMVTAAERTVVIGQSDFNAISASGSLQSSGQENASLPDLSIRSSKANNDNEESEVDQNRIRPKYQKRGHDVIDGEGEGEDRQEAETDEAKDEKADEEGEVNIGEDAKDEKKKPKLPSHVHMEPELQDLFDKKRQSVANTNIHKYDDEELRVSDPKGEFALKNRAPKDFSEMGLPSTLEDNLALMGYSAPSRFQAQVIPIALKRDVLVIAQTGSGKTACYMIALVVTIMKCKNKMSVEELANVDHFACIPYGLIICPTRELALQIHAQARMFTHNMIIQSAVMYGGEDWKPQLAAAQGRDIITATPGRLLDCANRGQIQLHRVVHIVLDECDKMLDKFFRDPLCEVLGYARTASPDRRVSLFSATCDVEMQKLAQEVLDTTFVFVQLGKMLSAGTNILQEFCPVTPLEAMDPDCNSHVKNQEPSLEDRYWVLQGILMKEGWMGKIRSQDLGVLDASSSSTKQGALRKAAVETPAKRVLLFCRTMESSLWLTKKLRGEPHLANHVFLLYGQLPQAQREQALHNFEVQPRSLLVATYGLLGRGIDIPDVLVIHFETATNIQAYLHATGRTGRAGQPGRSIALVWPKDPLCGDLIKHLRNSKHPIPKWLSIAPEITTETSAAMRDFLQWHEISDGRDSLSGSEEEGDDQQAKFGRSHQRA